VVRILLSACAISSSERFCGLMRRERKARCVCVVVMGMDCSLKEGIEASRKGKESNPQIYADESRLFKRKGEEKKLTWIYRMVRIRRRKISVDYMSKRFWGLRG